MLWGVENGGNMYWVAVEHDQHVAVRWIDLSVYQELEMNDEQLILYGKHKDHCMWKPIKKFETLNEMCVWCHDNIPLGYKRDMWVK